MGKPRTFHLAVYAFGLGGAALLTYLIMRQGASQVGAALAQAGLGLVCITAIHPIRVLADTAGWQVLVPRRHRLPWLTALWMHWLGESVSDVLPAARIGGDIVTARLAAIHGMSPRIAAASVLADVTICAFCKVAFVLIGLVLLVAATGKTALVGPTVIGVLIGGAAIGIFYLLQRRGIFRGAAILASRLRESWSSLEQHGEAVDRTVRRLYSRKRAVIGCCLFALISWLIGAGEVWIAFIGLGAQISFWTVIILETVTQAIRGVTFLVPGALGIQEGGYLVVARIVNISGSTALAAALVRRARELILGIPGAFIWQLIEARHALKTRLNPAKAEPNQPAQRNPKPEAITN
jgi:putative membrane protein